MSPRLKRALISLLPATGLWFALIATAAAQTRDPILDAGGGKGGGAGAGLALLAGVMQSDNIERASTDERSELIGTVGTRMNLLRDGTRFDYDLKGDLQWAEYLDNTYPGQFFGNFNGTASFAFIPRRLQWNVRDSVGTLATDPFVPSTPDTLATLNYFSTGPEFHMLLGPNNQLSAYAEYGRTTSHTEAPSALELDSKRYSGGVSVAHAMSDSTQVSLAGDTEKVEYLSTTANVDYRRNSVTAAYAAESRRTRLLLSAGFTRFEGLGQKADGVTGSADLSRRVSSASVIYVRLNQSTADAADLLRSDLGAPALGGQSAGGTRVVRLDPVKRRGAQAGWRYETSRNSLILSAAWSQERGDISDTLDRDTKGVAVEFRRRLRPTLSLNVLAREDHEDFSTVDYTDKQRDGTVALQWHAGRKLSVALQFQRYELNSSDNTSEYSENRLGIQFAYQVVGLPAY